MESTINQLPNIDISLVKRYSLDELDGIDFSTSDDFAIVVENLKNIIVLEKNIEGYWNEEHEKMLWQFVIDTESCIITIFFLKNTLFVQCGIPSAEINEIFYMIKVSSEKLVSTDYAQKLLYGSAKAPFFESLYDILNIVYEPMFSENSDWSKCIKSDYKHHLSNFILELFHLKSKLRGELSFCAPNDIESKDIESVIKEKELLNQVEKTVIKWIWLLMSALMKQNNDNQEDLGPLDEIKFWQGKSSELEKVLLQLEQKNVKICIEIIKTAKLVSYFKFVEVYNQLQHEFEAALDNVKFLSILRQPCEEIEKASLPDIPKHLTLLLDLVRIIWNNSSYYKQQNEISNLLNKVNNFVVKVISNHIPLEEIFCEPSSEQKQKVSDVIACCVKWMDIFAFSEKVHQKHTSHVWSVKPVSPLINLFVHRCEELIQICQFKKDFHYEEDTIGYATGHKCFQISEQFKIIEENFWKLLRNLGENKQSALLIRKATWYELFKKFKEQINDLEILISKLMVNSFENLNAIEEGIQILAMFQRHFENPVMKRYLRKCIKSLYDIFFNELNSVKKEMADLKSTTLPLLPKYGGIAFTVSLLPKRVKQLYKLLQESSSIWPREYDIDIENYYKQVLSSTDEFIHILFLEWTKTIPKDPYVWLKEPVFMKQEFNPFLQLNLNSKTLSLINELYYWDKAGIEIPHHIVHLHEKSDLFMKRISKMTECAQNHNRLVQHILLEDAEIFSEMLHSMEENIKSSVDNLTWSVSPSVVKSALKKISDQTKLVKEVFSAYDTCKLKLKECNEKIATKSLFSTKVVAPLKYEDFIHMQVLWKESILQEISELIECEIYEANQVRNVFKKKKLENGSLPAAFTRKVIDLVCAALVGCYETSLKEATVLFGANRRNKIKRILNIELTLKNRQLCYIPNFKELCTGIDGLFKNIEESLSACMTFEGLMSENVDQQKYFMENVSSSNGVQELKKEIEFGLILLYEAQKSYIADWNPCACLWQTAKIDLLKNYQDTGWKAENFEKDISRFLDIGEKAKLYSRYKVLEFCIVDCQNLKDSAAACAEEWRTELGLVLRKISSTNLQNAFDLFELTATKFKHIPCNLEEMKHSINFMRVTKKCADDIQLTFGQIQQSFDVLYKFNIPISEKTLDQQQNLKTKWKEMENNFDSYYSDLQRLQASHQRRFLGHQKELVNFTDRLEKELFQKGPFQLNQGYSEALSLISHYKSILNQLQLKEEVIHHDADFFYSKIRKLEKLSSMKEDLNNLEIAWTFVYKLNEYLDEWDNSPVMHFNVEQKEALTDDLKSKVIEFDQKLKGNEWNLLRELRTNIIILKDYYKMILNFQDPTLQDRHWDEFKQLLNFSCDNSRIFFHSLEFTFGLLRRINIENLAESVNKIALCSRKEYEIEQSLAEMELTWKRQSFKISDLKIYFKLENTEEIKCVIEKQQEIIKNIKKSKYNNPFLVRVESLENSLLLFLDVIDQIEYFQNNFFLLENIFVGKNLQENLPIVSKDFQSVKEMWELLTKALQRENLVWTICHKPGFLEKLSGMNKALESVQDSLEFLLDSKRQAFPRFCYLSNKELLSIIGQTSPDAIQPHLQKCFDSIDKLKIVKKVEETLREKIVTITATGMCSKFDEFVEFDKPVILKGPVESWMNEVESSMHSTLQADLPKSLASLNSIISEEDFDILHSEWLNMWCSQICLIAILIAWTAESTNSIKRVQETAVTTALKTLRKKWREILNQSIQRHINEDSPSMQKKTISLILILSHCCEVIESLIKYVCNNDEAFEWLVHLRYYFEENVCFIRQTKAKFKYGYEYLGNRERLVITPLTNRCFLSLTTAMYLKQAVILRGCRSSGKSETLKDLGVALGNYVLSINCSENLNLKSIVNIMSGLAKIGAWGLFKDFNRLRSNVVSVVSQQSTSFLHAFSEKQKIFSCFGKDIPLSKRFGIFFSFNSDFSVSSYMKCQTFRPVTIIYPDILAILKIYLLAFGFSETKVMASGILLICNMAKEQLSKNTHNNFGLKSIIQFLKYLEQQKRLFPKSSDKEIVFSSLKSITIPKLEPFDIPVFESILNSVLGSVKILNKRSSEFYDEIRKTFERKLLQPESLITSKTDELHEMKKHNHALILLGESGSGKTRSLNLLKETYLNLRNSGQASFPLIEVYSFNPRAYSLKELFGNFAESGTQKDGLFPSVIKKANQISKANEKWIILDGPADIEWLGSISSLLNPSKVLTMANGERLLLSTEVTLIIETTDLTNCSPSIVSSCGIVFYPTSKNQWNMYIKSWILSLEDETMQQNLLEITEKYLGKVLEYSLSLESYTQISISLLNCVTSFTRIMNSFLNKKTLSNQVSVEKLSRIFWFSIVWSIGAILNEKDRQFFNEYLKQLDSSLEKLSCIYEYGINSDFEWFSWTENLLKKSTMLSSKNFENLCVPTASELSAQTIVTTLIKEMRPVLLYGKKGSGKTLLANDLLHIMDSDHFMYSIINMDPQVTSCKLQQILEMKLEKRPGGLLLPPSSKKMIAFIDDFHKGTSDNCLTPSPLEFLYMTIDDGLCYNRESWKSNHIQNVSFLAATNSSLDCHSRVSQRLLNRFSIINISPPSDSEMEYIFSTLLKENVLATNKEVLHSLNAVSKASVIIYEVIRSIFQPIPSKLHYLFSIKDIKKVLCKICEISDDILNDKLTVAKIWFHECIREISDRLMCIEEKELFTVHLNNAVKEQFTLKSSWNENDKCKFVKFLHVDKGFTETINDSILTNHLETCCEEYVQSKSDQNAPIILFENNIQQILKILRVIENTYGNLILVGASGTGKRSLCKIAAFILKYELIEISCSESYRAQEFKQDLHKVLYNCGVNCNKVLLMLSADQVIDKNFFYYLSEILSQGLPFDIFTKEDLNMIYSAISSSSKIPLENTKCHELFVQNIKKNLHIVLNITYNSDVYRTVFLNFSAFYKHCTIIWFEEWPSDALESIACQYLTDANLQPLDTEIRKFAFKLLAEIQITALKHSNARNLHTLPFETSSSFFKLIYTFEKVFIKRQAKVGYELNRLESGLQKINETQQRVNEISKETKEAQEKLRIAERECDVALKNITQKKITLAEKQKTIQLKTVEIEAKEKVCKKITIAAEEDLNATLPALTEAQKALEALNKRDIVEIKSYAKPPALVEIVLEAVMILRNSEPSWTEAKRQLGNSSFLKELFEYDRDNISDSALANVEKYVKKPEFQPNIVGKVSLAAKSLCIWVRAMHLYGNIYKKVKPKMERLRAAKEELEYLQQTLAELLQELKELESGISQLEKEHALLIERKELYAKKEKELAQKLKRAESIIEGLSAEKRRWDVKVTSLKQKKIFILGDSCLASGYLTYLGPYDQSHRIHMRNTWQKRISEFEIEYSSNFDLADFFMEESVKDEWKTLGLPSDQYSQEGAAIVIESSYCPIVVDPEGQAVKWIKNMELKKGLKCADFQDAEWNGILENAITKGFPVLLQNVNPGLDSSLFNLLRKPSSGTFIQFNDKTLELNPSFQFYMSTKLFNPQFTSTVIHKTCIVNFTIKEKGLEDQLLPLIVSNERLELETKKENLVQTIRDCKKQLSEIENTVLKLLNESQGSLLDDEVIVQTLKRSKTASVEAEDKLITSEKAQVVIDVARNKYRPCAKAASILYFVLTDMSLVDPIYACRTVRQKHSLLLAFHLITKMLIEEGKLDRAEYEFFIKGGKGINRSQEPPNPCSQWLSQESWDNITQLEHLPKFLSITISFDEDSRLWKDWYLSMEPEKKPLPGIWRNVCSGFHLLLIIRSLRLDRVATCIRDYISSTLGESFLEHPRTVIKEVFNESTPNKPTVVFTLSADVDLEKDIFSLSKDINVQCSSISLSEGQEKAASQLIINAAKKGHWAVITNCHLLLSWLPTMEKFINVLQTLKVHENFRLWLSSSPTKDFPTSILQNSVILSLDSPKGIRNNMLKLYTSITETEIETSSCPLKFQSLLFTLSFFHSILIGRKHFENLGWHCNYDFTNQDFEVSKEILKSYLDDYKDTPFDALKQLIASVIYGGHLEHYEDESLLETYFDNIFCDEAVANVKYCFSSVGTYYVPDNGPLEEHVNFIKELPSTDIPEVFGQHHNAEIPYQVQIANEMLKNISEIIGENSSQNCDFDKVDAIISDIILKIPNLIDEAAAMDILNEKPDPYNTILVKEVKQYNHLLEIVLHSISDLKEAICGKQMLTEELDRLSKTIRNMDVPEEWLKIYPSMKSLGSWIQDLGLRVCQFTDWISSGNMPVKIWLPGFISPTSMLYAALQEYAKNNDITIKELIWEHHVSVLDESHITEVPLEGIYVRGLLLQGAGWDKTNTFLIDPEPLHLTTNMPVIHFKPVTESSIKGVFNCPCYYTSAKTDQKGNSMFLFCVDLKSKKGKEHWIKLGTSLALSSK
ncbi:hypothetical protein JTE90_005951 [Oedothorax gibbosus]|uniref:AAA+ ATPase domain-containing protein n=1 Tax=Oedothorax gibbosus TaxID=931172 RepID=A0AAV6UVS9_9ARAC|nr:hypothetical protein JTE90_005951 [Oedothorax gibbosus]